MWGVVNSERVWRSAVFPIAFTKKRLSPKALFRLYGAEESPFVLEMSLVREKYAPSLAMVHAFGCRLATSQKQNLIAQGKGADRIYCGAYQLRVEDIRCLSEEPQLPEIRKAEVLHVVEKGELAHAHMQIEVDTGGDKEAIEPVKTLIVDRIWNKSAGPARHICPPDSHLKDHPSGALDCAPNGPCVRPSKTSVLVGVILCFLLRYPVLWAKLKAESAVAWAKTTLRRYRKAE
jgi:hypothetical protein